MALFVFVVAFSHGKGKMPCLSGLGTGAWKIEEVDDVHIVCALTFLMQMMDVFTDVMFCIEAYLYYEAYTKRENGAPLSSLVIAILATAFLVVPYLANLGSLLFLKKKVETINRTAQDWFRQNTTFIAILVVLSGGLYPSLSLARSNIFGVGSFVFPWIPQ